MANMSLEKIKMPEQAPDVRNKNFKEVSLGYTEEMAIEEAQRCLNCKHKPCVSGCPVNVRIPEFIAEVAKGDFMAAYKVILYQCSACGLRSCLSTGKPVRIQMRQRHEGRGSCHRSSGTLRCRLVYEKLR